MEGSGEAGDLLGLISLVDGNNHAADLLDLSLRLSLPAACDDHRRVADEIDFFSLERCREEATTTPVSQSLNHLNIGIITNEDLNIGLQLSGSGRYCAVENEPLPKERNNEEEDYEDYRTLNLFQNFDVKEDRVDCSSRQEESGPSHFMENDNRLMPSASYTNGYWRSSKRQSTSQTCSLNVGAAQDDHCVNDHHAEKEFEAPVDIPDPCHDERRNKKVKLSPSKSANYDEQHPQETATEKVAVLLRIRTEESSIADGCRWRKYGRKKSEGSPYSREYHRCTMLSSSCPARKQVQRCSKDGTVLTLKYIGEHNHHLSPIADAMASATSDVASMLLSSPLSSTDGLLNATNIFTISSSDPYPTIIVDLTKTPTPFQLPAPQLALLQNLQKVLGLSASTQSEPAKLLLPAGDQKQQSLADRVASAAAVNYI